MDQFERGKLLLTNVESLIIDEADRMLDMGFIPDIERICKLIPAKRQTLLFSATMPKEIANLAKKFQKDPMRIEVSRPTETASTITQHVVKLTTNDAKAKRTALRRVIENCDVQNGIVFCNRKREVDIVTKSLCKHGFDAAAIHGDLPQAYRSETLRKFRDGELKLLVASDVAARGLDIPEVSHVFNFAPPPKDEDYIHRIGRTGRAGRSGESYTIVSPEDEKSWGYVVKMIGKEPAPYMPDGLETELKELPADRGDNRRGKRRGGRGRDDRPTDKRRERSSDRNDGQHKPSRNRKRSDEAFALEPAEDGVKGFGDNIPDFLKR